MWGRTITGPLFIMMQDKEKQRARQRRYSQKMWKYLANAKNVPCKDCRLCFPPYVMDCDHKNGDKDPAARHGFGGNWSIKRLQAEIDKCDIVCANCHRIRTFARKEHIKWM